MILRPDQEKAVQSLFDFYASGMTKDRNPLIGMPTGYGKTPVIAEFCKRSLHFWPDTKIIVATHRKGLIEQNVRTMLKIWPTAPIGIYSAGLKQRDTMQPIIYGGIQSLIRAKDKLGFRHLMLVDEAHLVSEDIETTYFSLIDHFKKINPYFTVPGLSATLYRTGSGPLDGGGIFTDVIFDCTSLHEFNRVLDEGWLCTLIPKCTATEMSVEGVGWSGDDYNQSEAQAAVDKPDITLKCCRETIAAKHTDNRKSCLIFAQGIEHADHIVECLTALGQHARPYHEGVPEKLRDEYLTSFTNGTLDYLVNKDMLTTGFDFPGLDMISVMRLIGSPGLWVQILGRLTRVDYAPGYPLSTAAERLLAIAMSRKPNGLVLDFGGNTKRLGPINDPVKPKRRGKKRGTPGVAPIKICPKCNTYNHASATKCCNPACALEFSREQKLFSQASEDELIRRSTEPQFELYDVENVIYTRHEKSGTPTMMKVSYFEGIISVPHKEIVCVEHTGFGRREAMKWWNARSGSVMPNTVDEVLRQTQFLRTPKQLKIWTNSPHGPKIVEYIWEETQ